MRAHPRIPSLRELSRAERRVALLLGLRWQDKGRLDRALAEMSKIRARMGRKIKRFDAAAAIRRLRDSR